MHVMRNSMQTVLLTAPYLYLCPAGTIFMILRFPRAQNFSEGANTSVSSAFTSVPFIVHVPSIIKARTKSHGMVSWGAESTTESYSFSTVISSRVK